jgi:hypothetical protein
MPDVTSRFIWAIERGKTNKLALAAEVMEVVSAAEASTEVVSAVVDSGSTADSDAATDSDAA